MTKFLWTSAAAVALSAVALTPNAPADDKAGAPAAPDQVRQITLAYDLAEHARASKSAELLVAAARMLRQIDAKPGEEKVEGNTGEKLPPVSLKEESNKLLAEAKKLAPDDAIVAELADRVTKLDSDKPKATGERGSFGGPKYYRHQPGAGTVITWNVRFRAGQTASASVVGNGRNTLTLRVTGSDGTNLVWTSRNPSLTWVPGAAGVYTITVTNNGPGACAYTLYHN